MEWIFVGFFVLVFLSILGFGGLIAYIIYRSIKKRNETTPDMVRSHNQKEIDKLDDNLEAWKGVESLQSITWRKNFRSKRVMSGEYGRGTILSFDGDPLVAFSMLDVGNFTTKMQIMARTTLHDIDISYGKGGLQATVNGEILGRMTYNGRISNPQGQAIGTFDHDWQQYAHFPLKFDDVLVAEVTNVEKIHGRRGNMIVVLKPLSDEQILWCLVIATALVAYQGNAFSPHHGLRI